MNSSAADERIGERAASPQLLGSRTFVAMWCNCPIQKHIGDKANGNSGDDELRAERRTRRTSDSIHPWNAA
jgi:hypothetical protein